MKKRLLALMLSVTMVATAFASCNNNQSSSAGGDASGASQSSDAGKESQYNTIVIGTQIFEGKFNPLYAESAYDQQVMDQIFVAPARLNAKNELVDWGGSITYESYTEGDVNYTKYTVKVQEGMKFSDGEDVTIDDYLYSIYAMADPSYTGPSATFYTTNIVGLKEYYYDDPNYSETVAGFATTAQEKYSLATISKEDYIAYLIDTNLEGWWNGDPAGDAGGVTWSEYITGEGFGDQLAAIDATDPAAMLALLAEVEYTNYADGYDPQTYYQKKMESEYIRGNLDDGIDVETISGIERVDDYTATVLFDEIDIYGDRAITASYVPEHFYGSFEKGHAEEVLRANMDSPMGSGPYKWVSYENNIVTLEANDDYWEGEPNIKNVKFQYVPDNDIIAQMVAGNIDVANPNADAETIEDLEENGMEYTLVDNNGYGYVGLNANNLDLNVRKGFMHLLNRKPSVEGYYGELASVIERPMTTTQGEYPHDATEYYGYDPEKAKEYFEADGYTLVDGKLQKDGKQLVINVYIGGDGQGDHPSYAMLTQAAEDLREMGGEMIINDVQFSVLQAAMNDGTADVFCLAWGASNSCDKTTIYHSNGGQNRYNLKNAEVDKLLEEIVKTVDFDERCQLVSDMLDLVMDEAVEMPVYQRKNMLAYNPEIVDTSSLPEETTPYWNYASELWKLRLH